MKTTGTVIEVCGTEAIVETERVSACDGCHKKAEGQSCSVCSLMTSGKGMRARVQNPVGAQIGDLVSVESESTRILGYAALVFLLPILTAAGGWFLAGAFTAEILWKGLGAVLGAVLTFVGLRLFSKRLQKNAGVSVITGIIRHKD